MKPGPRTHQSETQTSECPEEAEDDSDVAVERAEALGVGAGLVEADGEVSGELGERK